MTRHISFMDRHARWHCINVADVVHVEEFRTQYDEDRGIVVHVRGTGGMGWEFWLPDWDMARFERHMYPPEPARPLPLPPL